MPHGEAIKGQGHHTQCRKGLGSHRYERGGHAQSCHQHGSFKEGMHTVCVRVCVMATTRQLWKSIFFNELQKSNDRNTKKAQMFETLEGPQRQVTLA